MRVSRDGVHAALTTHPRATIDQLAQLLNVPAKSIENHLLRLARDGRAQNLNPHGGRGKPGAWVATVPSRAAARLITSVWDLSKGLA